MPRKRVEGHPEGGAPRRRPGPKPDPSKARSRYNPNSNRGREERKNTRMVLGGLCRNGHLLDEQNAYYAGGYLRCRVCLSNSRRKVAGKPLVDSVARRMQPQCSKGHPYPEGREPGAGCKICARMRRIEKKYGLTVETYDALLAGQGNKCAVCKISFDEAQVHIDHDHDTGAVRGALCSNCNTGLGLLLDDPVILRNALAYLAR